MSTNKYKSPFIENGIYHIYNRTNNKELLFKNDSHKNLFLTRYDHYTAPFLETYSWNLLPNHFHLLVKIKDYDAITDYLTHKSPNELCTTEKNFLKRSATIHELIDNAFQRFLISYAMSFNRLNNRKGNLLHRPFKHVYISKDAQFTHTVIYINANAQKHKIMTDFTKYAWCSYPALVSEKPTKLLRSELLEWFGGKALFIKTLKEQTKYYYSCDVSLDDD